VKTQLIFTGVAEKFIHVKAQLIFTGVAEKFKFILKISQTVVT
jgi:hypothetical protein